MIVVKVELWPFGDETRKREIGRAQIINDGTGSQERGHYDVELLKSAEYSKDNAGKTYRRGRVVNFRRQLGPWPLLMYALQSALRVP